MAQTHSIHNPFTPDDVERGLLAIIQWRGNVSAAARWLNSNDFEISTSTLSSWKHVHAIRYDELREKHAPDIEANLAHETREVAALANAGTRLAVEKAIDLLESNEEKDPARAAANLARVNQSAVDKLMTLTNRPTQITETRDVGEILRSLARYGIVKIPDAEIVEIAQGDGSEQDSDDASAAAETA